MKMLKHIYTLLVAILLGFFSFACSDDDVEQTEAEKLIAIKKRFI